MLYKPETGKIKDGCMLYDDGRYYLYSMYHKENSDTYNHVWLAISDDGVHFRDYGCVVEDFPDYIWAMKVYRGRDGFYMNSGSFSAPGVQNVLKFWFSKDLLHWEYKPELDVISPPMDGKECRLDCMNVVYKDSRYYGYATGQRSFLYSDDGSFWKLTEGTIDYDPFPVYNKPLGGFEVADCIYFEDTYYLFCGGFGHLGTNGYGVFLYESKEPFGPFRPSFPNYRISGTSRRWCHMWERCFEKDGKYLAHNYMYDGYSYENGNTWLPLIKEIRKDKYGLYLHWWEGNDILIGTQLAAYDKSIAVGSVCSVFSDTGNKCVLADTQYMISDADVVIICKLALAENTFTEYSSGGIYLSESEKDGTAILFDTYGKCEIAYVQEGKIVWIEDTISFGSAVPYYLESGKTYEIKILSRHGMWEIYVDNRYLQTFNTVHAPDMSLRPFQKIGAVSCRGECIISEIVTYKLI